MAKRFKFRLETVQKVRRQREDAAKRVVAERLREIAAVHADIGSMQEQIRREIDGFRQTHATGRIDVTQIARHRHWLVQLDQSALTCRSRLAELQDHLSHERGALTEARREVRILEKLEERQRERYMKELARAENRENDEIGNALYFRQRASVAG